MHDVGMNMGQLEMSVKQVDDTIALARSWSHELLHATEAFDMQGIGGKLETALRGLKHGELTCAATKTSLTL